MIKWEYMLVPLPTPYAKDIQAMLNHCGSHGWEVIVVDPAGKSALMKRPAGSVETDSPLSSSSGCTGAEMTVAKVESGKVEP